MASNKKKTVIGAVRSQFEKYEIQEIHREALKNAPYNPRAISAKAKKALKTNLEKVGLLAPIIWNRRTGNIVSGHQRISALDALERSHDYLVKVAVVDLDEKTEKEQNIFMNNEEAQGDFDVDLLGKMLKDGDIDIYNTGFDLADLHEYFSDTLTAEQAEQTAQLSNEMHKAIEMFEKAEGKSHERNDTEFYLVAVFKSREARSEFCARHGLRDMRYVDGAALDDLLSNSRLPDSKTAPK